MAGRRTETIELVIEPLVNTLRVELERAGIPVEQIILFGSYARGSNSDASDIDLAIVSSVFTGIRFHDISHIVDSIAPVNSRLEIHPYRPDDFAGNDPFASEILRTGTVLYDRRVMSVS